MQKWLLISNCQTEGLRNSLTVLCPDAHIEAIDIWSFQTSSRQWSKEIPNYDRVIATKETIDSRSAYFEDVRNLIRIPNFIFRAFHPDMCYVYAGGSVVSSPLRDYQSAICVAAYKAGYSAEETVALYNGTTFEALGYLSLWETEKSSMIETYKAEGIDIRSAFLEWSRLKSPFMHVFNHPKINVIYDISQAILNSSGIKFENPNFIPHDNLTILSIFPVYPEIAERYGFGGSASRFKLHDSYRTISLCEFVGGCFEIFDNYERSLLSSDSPQFYNAYKLFSEAR